MSEREGAKVDGQKRGETTRRVEREAGSAHLPISRRDLMVDHGCARVEWFESITAELSLRRASERLEVRVRGERGA